MAVTEVPPTFTQGQVLSASLHLNALQAYVQGLADDFRGTQMPFGGIRRMQQRTNSAEWYGVMRHKHPALYYDVNIDLNAGPLYILVNNVVSATLSGNGRHTGTIDLTSFGFVVNGFYPISFSGANDVYFTVWKLSETYTVSLPSLASFVDDTTPTAAEWQALSTYAAALGLALGGPTAAVTQYRLKLDGSNQPTGFWPLLGMLNHRARYLNIGVHATAPYWGDTSTFDPDPAHNVNSGARWTAADVYIDGTLAARFVVGTGSPSGTGNAHYEAAPGGPGAKGYFVAQIDLEDPANPLGLTYGQDYELVVKAHDSTGYPDTESDCWVDYCYESPDLTVDPLSLTQYTEWAHGDLVRGDTGSPNMQALRDNLLALGSALTYHNYASRAIINTEGVNKGFIVRRGRFLHYLNAVQVDEVRDANGVIIVAGVNPQPAIIYEYQGKAQVVSLPDASTQWGVYDLDTAPGLFPGVLYTVTGLIVYAVEDSVP